MIKKKVYVIIALVKTKESRCYFLVLVAVIITLIIIILCLTVLAVAQIKMAGMNVKDFWTFIKAIQDLDVLYKFTVNRERHKSLWFSN